MSTAKKHALLFIFLIFMGLSTVPITNIFLAINKDEEISLKKDALFNSDFLLMRSSEILYPFGISVDPENAIIGYDNWLYLGDLHSKTRSLTRLGPSANTLATARKVAKASKAWEKWLKRHGVSLYRIMVSPNKGTIYSEYLPNWAKPSSQTFLDEFFRIADNQLFIDLRRPLFEAKQNQDFTLYYRTDTHWNNIGAGLAFKFFTEQIDQQISGINWLKEEVYKPVSTTFTGTGDLVKFLRLNESIKENIPNINIYPSNFQVTQYDYSSGVVTGEGPNIPIPPPHKPVRVTSVNALNNYKVLWIRDSFGTALSQLMAATFSDVLQIHPADAFGIGKNEGSLTTLVKDYNPQFVFVTIVERDILKSHMTKFPPEGSNNLP